jgi:proteic killer suppression protein
MYHVTRVTLYHVKPFRGRDTEKLFDDRFVRLFQPVHRAARRKLESLGAAISLEQLGKIPGNRLEKLKGDRAGQYSIRINVRWRVCFEWLDDDAHNVEIVDYH